MEEPLCAIQLPFSDQELEERFDRLQQNLVPLWKSIESLNESPQTIVVLPSLTVDFPLRGSKLQAYEERFLFLLLLLRQPRAELIYITSQRIQPLIVDYYLGLLPGVIASHARKRLHLISPEDGSQRPLSLKILERPRLLRKICDLIDNPRRAHLVPFNTTRLERDLSLRLGIPMYGADPKFAPLGTKSGCRRLFAQAGMSFPAGREDLRSFDEIVEAVSSILAEKPSVRQLMLKHNEGVSGSGNAVLDLAEQSRRDTDAIAAQLRQIQIEDPTLSTQGYFDAFERHGGIVEERIQGEELRSPSVQLRITPLGKVEVLSTHDQLLGGETGQSYLGCKFPADASYASIITVEALKAAQLLSAEGVIGRFAIDFITARTRDSWVCHAIELNLRKGGTTHPYLTLQFLTDGLYDPQRALFLTPGGQSKYFLASDHLESQSYRALTPEDALDTVVMEGLHFDQTRETGVVLHMMTALGEHGLVGLTAVGDSAREAEEFFRRTQTAFDRQSALALTQIPLPEFD